jgi:histone H3/H4
MHPIEHYETLRRGREELLKRAEYERMARKAMVEQRVNKNIQQVTNWLGIRLVSLGEKLEQFGASRKRQPAPTTTTQVGVRTMSKMSPHN